VYSILVFLFGTFFLIARRIRLGRYRNTLLHRCGFFNLKAEEGARVIWIHAVSLGETKAIAPLYQKLRLENPDAYIVISNATETGQQEAQKSLKGADLIFYLPLDAAWIMRKLVRDLHPDLLIFVETDFWYNLIHYTRKRGGKVLLVNGKMSERSFCRWMKVPFLARRFFGMFDYLCVQNEEYRSRFEQLGISPQRLSITGNLKCDIEFAKKDPEKLQKMLRAGDFVILLASTHDPEEKLLLKALRGLQIPNLKILLAPRHPERFPVVADLLTAEKIPFLLFSKETEEAANVILIDAMGTLGICYQLSHFSLVCGSFIPGIGGHNLLEPLFLGSPVIFGPYTENQTEFAARILEAQAGYSVSIEQLPALVTELLVDPRKRQELTDRGADLIEQMRGATERTLVHVRKMVPEKNRIGV